LPLGDKRPGNRCAEQILAFIERIAPKHREHVVAHKLLAQVLDEDVLRLDAECKRLLPRRLELVALAEIGGKGGDTPTPRRLPRIVERTPGAPPRESPHRLSPPFFGS